MDRRLQGLLLFFFVLVSISRCVFSRGAGISLGSPRRANVVGGLVAEHDDGHPAESSSAEREIDGSFAKLTGRGGGAIRREVEEHNETHGHEHDGCLGELLEEPFHHLAEEEGICTEENDTAGVVCSSCEPVFDLCLELIASLNSSVVEELCHHDDEAVNATERVDSAKAYGYGFLMVSLVSLCSLFGVALVPFLNKESRFGVLYKYIYSFMIALGTSALFCDAILHLIPEGFGLHSHSELAGAHAHEEEGGEEEAVYYWRGCVIIAGVYVFFILEVLLHAWNSHSGHDHHSHGIDLVARPRHEVTVPHGHVRDAPTVSQSDAQQVVDKQVSSKTPDETAFLEGNGGGKEIAKLSSDDIEDGGTNKSDDGLIPERKGSGRWWKLKPLAWLIIIGDGIHNFADGLALGASISQSLALGISTTIAIVFHELPHEFGDYAILLSTGLKWWQALLFNFLSSLSAIIGFFIGVAVGSQSEDATSWILLVAAGIFIYVALVDLLPELIHIKEQGCLRWGLFAVANAGFFVSFAVLLVIAIYEEELNTLFV